MPNNFLIKRNRKAQIGETMTWVVATIIILFVLSIFIYTANLLAGTKSLTLSDSKINLDKNKDILRAKSLFAHEKTSFEKKDAVKQWIEKNNG